MNRRDLLKWAPAALAFAAIPVAFRDEPLTFKGVPLVFDGPEVRNDTVYFCGNDGFYMLKDDPLRQKSVVWSRLDNPARW